MRIKLGWRVFLLFIILYGVAWSIFGLITPGAAVVVTLLYWYLEAKFQKKERNPGY